MNLSIGNLSKKTMIILMMISLLVAAILILSHRKEHKDQAERNIRQTNLYSGRIQHDNHEPASADQQQSSPEALNEKIARWKQNYSALSEKIEILQSQIDALAVKSQTTADRTQVQDDEKSAVSETDIEN